MRLPINFLLYVASIAMLGCAGWLFVQATFKAPPLSGEETGPSFLGFKIAEQRVQEGQGLDRRQQGWNYDNREWWLQFTEVNLTGKLPPPPEETPNTGPTVAPVEVEKPLSEIFHLISLMYHNVTGGAETHVVIRYREDAGVQVPESVARQAGSSQAGSPMAAAQIPPVQPQGVGRRGGSQIRGVSQAPMSQVQDLLMHHLKVGESLWPPYSHIKLVSVAEDVRGASFLRSGVATATGEEPEPEEVFKNEMDLDEDVLRQLISRQREGDSPTRTAPRPVPNSSWLDVPETRQVGDRKYSISRADDALIREDPQQLLDKLTIRPYTSSTGNSSRDGVQLLNVDPELGRRFNVRAGDVILEVNGIPVKNRSQAISVGTKQYNQGTRQFVVRMMTMGRIEERTYSAPDK